MSVIPLFRQDLLAMQVQPYDEAAAFRKLEVDRPAGLSYKPDIDICLPSFGYCAFGTAP
jgi:hypothetical protein